MEISPMLLTEVYDKKVLEDTTKIFQEKFNGIRALIHIKNHRIVGIRNRSGNPILYLFPEFREIDFPFDTAVLDAEIVVFKEGKSVFYGGIDKRRSIPTESIRKDYPATIVVFDALKIDNNTLVMKPYKERYAALNVICDYCIASKFVGLIRVAQNYNGPELWDRVVVNNLEGVVIKNPNCIYEIGKRSKEMLKLKNYKLCDVVVERVEHNEKGVKIIGTSMGLTVECQLGGIFDMQTGSTVTIKYLDIAGNRLIQPTKVNREQLNEVSNNGN